ncbi:hypothetical protein GZ77_20800 [Endozoicomonas montiporae]|uniref:Uncharacterized protein n=1 Tax=Endozoicomonas montiporae TaxID=1027273 RepID=A0A081N358_9GAMM|nr:hypothetical protein GZ77_20800 [Endozoicomonas montiporae]
MNALVHINGRTNGNIPIAFEDKVRGWRWGEGVGGRGGWLPVEILVFAFTITSGVFALTLVKIW